MEPIIIFTLTLPVGLVLGFMAGLLFHDDIKDFQEWQKEKKKKSQG